jgi:hypothetical protein
MVMAWFRSLLIFDGFLAPEGTTTVPMPEPTDEPWLRQLLVLDGFLEAEREVQSAAPVPVEAQIAQAPKISLPAVPSENSESDTTVASVSPESVVPETTPSETSEPEISSLCEEAVTDWQRILGWKE